MTGSERGDGVARDSDHPAVSSTFEVGGEGDVEGGKYAKSDGPAPDEAFQTLASEVRVTVLVRLLSAERAGEDPLAFSELQEAAGSDSSAGFAYHLRQLSGHFVRRVEDGYVLTPPGRRAAEAVVSGAFTDGSETSRAS